MTFPFKLINTVFCCPLPVTRGITAVKEPYILLLFRYLCRHLLDKHIHTLGQFDKNGYEIFKPF